MTTFTVCSFYGRKRPSGQESDDESDDDVPLIQPDNASELSEEEVKKSNHDTGSEYEAADEDTEEEGKEEEEEERDISLSASQGKNEVVMHRGRASSQRITS